MKQGLFWVGKLIRYKINCDFLGKSKRIVTSTTPHLYNGSYLSENLAEHVLLGALPARPVCRHLGLPARLHPTQSRRCSQAGRACTPQQGTASIKRLDDQLFFVHF